MMMLCGTGACAVTLIGEPLIGTPYLLANGGEFLLMLVYTRRDSVAENRAM